MNKTIIDNLELPQEDLEVFLSKVGKTRRKKIAVKTASGFAILACALVPVFGIKRAPTAESIYSDYLARVETARQELSAGPSEMEWLAYLDAVTFENEPFASTLPAEMDKKDKARLAQEHYSSLLDGVNELMESYKNLE